MQGNEVQVAAEAAGGHGATLEKDAARDLTARIRNGLSDVYELIQAAYQGQAWKALGYRSWDAYVTEEFGNLNLRPPKESQPEVIRSLQESGMSVRAIRAATQLGYGTVQRVTSTKPQGDEGSGDPPGSPDPSRSQGRDGKTYPARRATPSVSLARPVVEGEILPDERPEQMSVEDVLAMPAALAGIAPLNLEERAGEGRERVTRILREFHGSGDAALPRTIKLAGQVAGLVSPVTGQSTVPDEDLHVLASDVSRGLVVFSFIIKRLFRSLAAGDSETEIKANLRDSVDELDGVLEQLEESR
ncbi:DNA-binding response regulator [uncultured Citricoccus sp.]|uniref:DNA-binding response regulator n=1 Tax=uncultured Citricoccus sp. TaxID=614031 RepID=UPI00262B6398|nr:DNA-binding response regulator [uncultured Citricoccus sp.]